MNSSLLMAARFATVPCATKRGKIVDGKLAMIEHLSDLRCTPLSYVDARLSERMGLEGSLGQLQQTTLFGRFDIQTGDILTVAGVDYPVTSAATYGHNGAEVTRVIVERIVS